MLHRVRATLNSFRLGYALGLSAFLAATSGIAETSGDMFVEHTGTANPFYGIDMDGVRNFGVPADTDNDGDLDVVVTGNPDSDGSFLLWLENTGTEQSPEFTRRAGIANPFDGIQRISVAGLAGPEFGDLDGDGDLDMALVDSEIIDFAFVTVVRYFENNGSGQFSEQMDGSNPFDGITTGSAFCGFFVFTDLDRDDDLDALIHGENSEDDDLILLENTGTAQSPAYTKRTGASNPFEDLVFGSPIRPTAADFDADNDTDVAHPSIDSSTFIVDYFQSSGGFNLTQRTGSANPFNFLQSDVGGTFVTHRDIDNDNDLDFITQGDPATDDSSVILYENTGTAQNGSFTARVGVNNPFDGLDFFASYFFGPQFADFDDDGDQDFLLSGEAETTLNVGIRYFENTTIQGVPANSLTDSWVDFSHAGSELGTQANPFNSVNEGVVALVNDGSGTLHIQSGATTETLSFSKPMTVLAEGGSVTVGQAP